MKKTHNAVTKSGSLLSKYKDVVVGHVTIPALVYYEWCMFLSSLYGALGLFLRKIFWPKLFASCGKGVNFGANITLRHPHRIHIEDRVVISEGCILDARNEESNRVIFLANDVILSNNVMISCKGGSIKIGARSGIGAQTIIHSADANYVSLGSDVIVGPRCYIVGGGNYNLERLDIPIWRQGTKDDGGVTIDEDVWLGANVTVLGGVHMGTGSVAAAGAIITKAVPARAICAGQPAKVLRIRDKRT